MAETTTVESSEPLVVDLRALAQESEKPAANADPGTAVTETETAADSQSTADAGTQAETTTENEQETGKRGRDPRINEYYKLQGQNAELLKRLEALEKQKPSETPKPTVSTEGKPTWDPEKYKDGGYEEFIADTSRWVSKQEREAERAETAKQKAQQDQQALQAQWQKKIADSGLADFDAVVSQAPARFTSPHFPQFAAAVSESDYGPQVLYYLAQNPAEVKRLDALSLSGQIRELGKLELKFEKPPQTTKTPVSKAPPPVAPLRGTAGAPPPKPLEQIAASGDLSEFEKAAGLTVNRGRFTGRRR